MSISFCNQNILRPNLKYKSIKLWLKYIIEKNGYEVGNLSYIFCNDEYLKDINLEFLSHDYYTDIITFDYCEMNFVNGDVFISTERVKDNSVIFGSNITEEFLRVIIHGLLHLLSYKDDDDYAKIEMRNKENEYLDLYKNKKDELFR